MPDELLITRSSTDPLAIGTYVPLEGTGFAVADGRIVAADWSGVLASREHYRRLKFTETRTGRPWVTLNLDPPMPQRPWFGTSAGLVMVGPLGSEYLFSVLSDADGDGSSRPDSPALQATPGPLPGLGVVAAYQASRRLRRRAGGRPARSHPVAVATGGGAPARPE